MSSGAPCAVIAHWRLGSEIPVYGIASVASPFSVSMIPINCLAAETRLIFRLAAKSGAF
jgi:hypothetical protein